MIPRFTLITHTMGFLIPIWDLCYPMSGKIVALNIYKLPCPTDKTYINCRIISGFLDHHWGPANDKSGGKMTINVCK